MSAVAKRLVLSLVILWRLECFVWLLQATVAVDTGCPLDFSSLDFTPLAIACSERDTGRCCHYVNALIGISLSRYANATSQIGVPSLLSKACFTAISNNLLLNGLASNATAFCGLGTKITVNLLCKGLNTTQEMEQTPMFSEVQLHCMKPVSSLRACRSCLNASIAFIHHLVDTEDNMTLSICRDATFVTIASYGDLGFAVDKASCMFGLQGLGGQPVLTRKPKPFFIRPAPALSPTPKFSPTSAQSNISFVKKANSSHWTFIASVGIIVTGVTFSTTLLLILLIHRKMQELKNLNEPNLSHWNRTLTPSPCRQLQKWRKGQSSVFKHFSYTEVRIATDDFSTTIGRGGFGAVYKAQFKDGLVAAVKQMQKVSGQAESEFCEEMKHLGRLHHRNIVTLRGFCAERHKRFLIYEYMENGSLKEHLHAPMKTHLNWQTRLQIAVDIAAALEYLHFYCDPYLCHGDIKSSKILLDENFIAKVADFGLAHVVPNGADKFETDVRGSPGYMDPEYMITQELTEKSDIYSYGVLLLELITGRPSVHENKNLVEWAQEYILTESRLSQIVDPDLTDTYNFEELQSLISIVRMCTQREGKARPSIRKVLHLLYGKLVVTSPNAVMTITDGVIGDCDIPW